MRSNGVRKINEIVVGLDAIVIVSTKNQAPSNFTQGQLFSALARHVEQNGKIVTNSAPRWSDIDPSLRNTRIQVMGPPPTSAAYYGFLKTIMDTGCASVTKIASMDESQRLQICRSLGNDGAFQEGPKLEKATVEWLQNRPSAYAIISYPTLQRNRDLLTTHTVEGVEPTVDTISNGKYPLVRPLYIYVKNQHIPSVGGLQKLLYEFTSERAIGPEGYLDSQGLVPQSDLGRNRARDLALSLEPVTITTRLILLAQYNPSLFMGLWFLQGAPCGRARLRAPWNEPRSSRWRRCATWQGRRPFPAVCASRTTAFEQLHP